MCKIMYVEIQMYTDNVHIYDILGCHILYKYVYVICMNTYIKYVCV